MLCIHAWRTLYDFFPTPDEVIQTLTEDTTNFCLPGAKPTLTFGTPDSHVHFALHAEYHRHLLTVPKDLTVSLFICTVLTWANSITLETFHLDAILTWPQCELLKWELHLTSFNTRSSNYVSWQTYESGLRHKPDAQRHTSLLLHFIKFTSYQKRFE